MKATRTLYASEDRPSAHVPIIPIQLPVLALAIVGLRRLWRSPTTLPLAMLLAIYLGHFYLTVSIGMPMIRYFVPAMPLLLAAAAAGLKALTERRLHSNPTSLHTQKVIA